MTAPTPEQVKEAVENIHRIRLVCLLPKQLETALDVLLAALEEARKDSAPLLTGRLINIGDSVLNGESVTGVFIEVHRSKIENLKYAPIYQDVTIAAAAQAKGET